MDKPLNKDCNYLGINKDENETLYRRRAPYIEAGKTM